MSSVSGLGPVPPAGEPRGGSNLSQALENYAKLLANPDPQKLDDIARKTVELDNLAHSVMNAASPKLRNAAGDLEHLLQSPLSVMNKEVSILTASKHHLENPATSELKDLVQELCNNQLALGLMCNELTILSGAIKSS